jgi:hypothetical protein
MIGTAFLLGFIMIEICLVDLLDLRYNNERSIVFIPSINLNWSGKGEQMIVTLAFAWLNLEFSIIGFNFDYYMDKLEHLINEADDDENNEE